MGLFDREWGPASRHWQGNQSEWDVVSASLDGERLILGECKALVRPATKADIERIVRGLMNKTIAPDFNSVRRQKEFVIFVPSLRGKPGQLPDCVTLVEGAQVFSALGR